MSPEDEILALREEVAALRALVGPSDESYAKLQLDVLTARDAAKGAEAELGTLRGTITEMSTQLARAQQSQDAVQRAYVVGRRSMGGVARRFRARRR